VVKGSTLESELVSLKACIPLCLSDELNGLEFVDTGF
jgi:hypothetical protein